MMVGLHIMRKGYGMVGVSSPRGRGSFFFFFRLFRNRWKQVYFKRNPGSNSSDRVNPNEDTPGPGSSVKV